VHFYALLLFYNRNGFIGGGLNPKKHPLNMPRDVIYTVQRLNCELLLDVVVVVSASIYSRK